MIESTPPGQASWWAKGENEPSICDTANEALDELVSVMKQNQNITEGNVNYKAADTWCHFSHRLSTSIL